MPAQLGDLYWVIRGDTAKLDSDIDKSVQQASKRVVDQGKKLTQNLTVPLVAFAAAGTKAFGDVNKGLRETVTLTGAAGAEADATFNRFNEQIQNLSSELGIAQTELVDGLYQSLSAGVPQDNVFDFLKTASEAAIAGVATTEEAVDGISTAINAFDLEFDQAGRVADIFFATVRNGKTTLAELSSSIGKVAPLAKLAGVSLEEVGASLSTLTSNGLNTAEATTQLRAALTAINRPTNEMVAVFRDLGFESAQAAIAEVGLQGALEAVFDSVNGNLGDLTALLGTQEAVGATALIAGTAQQKFASDLEQAASSAGSASAAFDEIDKARNFERAVNDIKNLAIEIGQALTPAAEGLAAVMSGVVAILDAIPDSALVGIGAVAAAIGPALIAAGKLQQAFTGLGANLATNLAKLATPLGLVTAAVGAATFAFVKWRQGAKEAAELADIYSDAINEATGGNDALERALANVNPKIDGQTDAFGNAADAASGSTAEALAFLAVLDKIEAREAFTPLLNAGLDVDTLAAFADGSATAAQIDEVTNAIQTLDDAGVDLDLGKIAEGFDKAGKAAERSAEENEKLADAQLRLLRENEVLTGQEETRIRIQAELAGTTTALSDATEAYFENLEFLEDLDANYGGVAEFFEAGVDTLDLADQTFRNMAASADTAAVSTQNFGDVLSTQLTQPVQDFISAAEAGALAGQELVTTQFAEIGLALDSALTSALDVDTTNGVNDVQEAINNIRTATDEAGASLDLLGQRVEAVEKLKELGPTIGTDFANIISEISAGAGDGLLDNILYGTDGTTPDLLAELEADLAAAEGLKAELSLEVDEAETEAFNNSFRDSFVAAATSGLEEFTAAISTSEPELVPVIDPTKADAELEELVERVNTANPELNVTVNYTPGTGQELLSGVPGGFDLPGFALGGQLPANSLVEVGEVRPELIRTDEAGRAFVFPNRSSVQGADTGGSGGITIENVNIAEAEASGDPARDLTRALYALGV